jgi:DNA polymerase-3 subunit epsilon
MAREIVLDTETTGLDPLSGHRMIELACIELEDLIPTGRSFHRYLDPEREIDFEAERVHGLSETRWIDTLSLAQKRFPGMYNSLDALCKRFRISLVEREKHGALIDAKLLANVYLELRGGRERGLDLTIVGSRRAVEAAAAIVYGPRPRPLAPRSTAEERAAHAAFIRDVLSDGAVWLEIELEVA